MDYQEARQRFGSRLQALRAEQKLTQEQLAEKLNKSVEYLNADILNKYRRVTAWYISLYAGIELREIYRLSPEELEPVFAQWEQKIRSTGQQLNNPKIPMRRVRAGQKVYPAPARKQEPPPEAE